MPAKLPESSTAAVVQRWLQGLSRDKIAEECGISMGAVSGIILNWKRGIGIDLADKLRDLSLGLNKMRISASQCADGFRVHQVLDNLDVDENDFELFATEIYKKSRAIGLGPQKITSYLHNLVSFAANSRDFDIEKSEKERENETFPTVPLLSQIPAYLSRMKAEKNHLEEEIGGLRSEKDSLLGEVSELKESTAKLLVDHGLKIKNLEFYSRAKAELENEGIPVEDIVRFRDGVKWVLRSSGHFPTIGPCSSR